MIGNFCKNSPKTPTLEPCKLATVLPERISRIATENERIVTTELYFGHGDKASSTWNDDSGKTRYHGSSLGGPVAISRCDWIPGMAQRDSWWATTASRRWDSPSLKTGKRPKPRSVRSFGGDRDPRWSRSGLDRWFHF